MGAKKKGVSIRGGNLNGKGNNNRKKGDRWGGFLESRIQEEKTRTIENLQRIFIKICESLSRQGRTRVGKGERVHTKVQTVPRRFRKLLYGFIAESIPERDKLLG